MMLVAKMGVKVAKWMGLVEQSNWAQIANPENEKVANPNWEA